MAKKQEKVSYQGDPGDEHVETVVKPKEKKWDLKDRTYVLKNNLSPLTFTLKSKNMMYFDENAGYSRAIQYCENQNTPFVDEMNDDRRMSHIVFRDGVLYVKRENVMLQKFLSIYHPSKDVLYYEVDNVKEAVDEVADLELELDAMVMARSLDIDIAEAIMRVEVGSKVSKMSSKELKRDLLLFAKEQPKLFLELAKDDNVHLRNMGIKAVEQGIINLSGDQRVFTWGSNKRKLMNVPFDEHPYSALAAWFKTDEGMEILQNIEKQLS
mgnify:FL=1|tara:strand:+ start:417 stop:1220 length:804 start_codon:yes stop_codon:yes gene_type:complete